MSRWPLHIPLARQVGAQPLTVQLAEGLAAAIRAGRLRGGARLPGTRALAAALGVHRNTVIAAYAELQAQGWLEARSGAGTFVSPRLPDAPPIAFASRSAPRNPDRVGFDLGAPLAAPRALPVQGLLSFGSTPDPREAPGLPLGRAMRRVMARRAHAVLDYGDPAGEPSLRAALAQMLAQTRGLTATAADVVTTRGSQMALYLLARALIRPGDRVAVEALGYRPAWAAFEAAGATLVPVSVDDHGLDVAQLEARAPDIRAVYLTPHHQYPTTVSLSPERRLALLAWAAKRRVAIVEDDYDNEFHYEGRPLLPLAAADAAGVVMYVGTLSKVLAPGLRLGYVVAPRPVLQRLATLRLHIDRQGDRLGEQALAELFADGEVQRHVRRMRRLHCARRDALAEALRRHLADTVTFRRPRGGMAIWARVDPAVQVDGWAARALQAGVAVLPGRDFTLPLRPLQAMRLGFAQMTPDELNEACRRLAATR